MTEQEQVQTKDLLGSALRFYIGMIIFFIVFAAIAIWYLGRLLP